MSKKIRVPITSKLRNVIFKSIHNERAELVKQGHDPYDPTPGFYPAELTAMEQAFRNSVVDLSDREIGLFQHLLLEYRGYLQERLGLLCIPDSYTREVQAQLDVVNKTLEKLDRVM